jgi:hypothetical protein
LYYRRGKGRLEIKDLENANYYYNFLAATTTVFKFSTTPAPSFIASRKNIITMLLVVIEDISYV